MNEAVKPTISLKAVNVYGTRTYQVVPNCPASCALFALLQRPLKHNEIHHLVNMGLQVDYRGDIKEALKNGEIKIQDIKNVRA